MQEKLLPAMQDKTYRTLHQWLTVGRFLPGERLKIRQAAEQGAHRMTDAAMAAQDAKAYLEANEAFRVTLYRASGSLLLMQLIDAHRDVMRALQQRDGATVRRAIEQDMFYAGQYLKTVCN